MTRNLVVRRGVVIDGSELSWRATRAGGPGGQNVNRVRTKVELRFALRASTSLTSTVKARLRRLARSRLDAEGNIVVVSQVERTQRRNLEAARQVLSELIQQALVAKKHRKKTVPSRSARRKRLNDKRHQSDKKRARQSPKDVD